jgi:ubiquinone/menaquinone biosynthesis C-methylase UbiE
MRPEELQKLYADRTAREGYIGDESSNRFQKVCSLMREYTTPQKVLDVGCATGSLLKSFTAVHDISGVDISEMFLEQARKNGYKKTVQLDVSTQPLPFEDKMFDVVFCGECIEHIVDTDWLYCEINRVLKTGGHFLLTFPNLRTPISFAMMLLNLPPMYSARYRAGHVRDFTTKTMKIALQNNGFRIDKIVGGDFYLPKIGGRLGWLADFLPSWSSTVVVRSVKTTDARYSIQALESTNMSESTRFG